MDAARNTSINRLVIGPWTFDVALRRLSCGKDRVTLRPKTAALLETLAQVAPQPVSRDDLLTRVWPDVCVGDESLTRAVAELRQAFGQSGRGSGPIKTVQKTGYRLALSAVADTPHIQSITRLDKDHSLNVIEARLTCDEARMIREKYGEWAANKALELCAEAARMAPEFPLIQAEYALSAADCRLYAPEGFDDLQHAIAAADRAIALRPDLAIGHMARGALCDAAGDMAGACRNFSQAILLDPKDAECHLLLARALYAGGDMARAARVAKVAATLKPYDYRPHYLAAGARVESGDIAGSIRAAEKGLSRLAKYDLHDPAELRAQNIKSSLLARAGRRSDAIEALEQYEKGGGRVTYYNVATLGWVGEVSAGLERLEQAIDGGFRNIRWARRDPALASLRRDRRFEKLLSAFRA